MRLLLVERATFVAFIWAKIEMDVVHVTSQPVGKVENLITFLTFVVALVQMRSNAMLGTIALLRKALSAYVTVKILDFLMNDAIVLAHGAGVTKRATAYFAFDILALSPLRLEGLRDFATTGGGSHGVGAAVSTGLRGGGGGVVGGRLDRLCCLEKACNSLS